MTFLEALKSGHPFKREEWPSWYDRDSVPEIDPDDMLEVDWIIAEASITLTKVEVGAMLAMAEKGLTPTPEVEEFAKRLRKYLGIGG